MPMKAMKKVKVINLVTPKKKGATAKSKTVGTAKTKAMKVMKATKTVSTTKAMKATMKGRFAMSVAKKVKSRTWAKGTLKAPANPSSSSVTTKRPTDQPNETWIKVDTINVPCAWIQVKHHCKSITWNIFKKTNAGATES